MANDIKSATEEQILRKIVELQTDTIASLRHMLETHETRAALMDQRLKMALDGALKPSQLLASLGIGFLLGLILGMEFGRLLGGWFT